MSSQNNTGKLLNTQRSLKKSRPYSSGMNIRIHSKSHGLITSKMSLKEEKMVFGLKTTVSLLILLGLITCTCNGQRLTLGSQNTGNLTEYSLSSGKRVKRITGATVCVTSRTDDLDLALWHLGKQSIKAQYHQTPGSEYYQRLVEMQKKCSQTRLFQYQQTTPSSSSQYKMVWIDQRQSSPTEFQRLGSPKGLYHLLKTKKNSLDSIQLLTGKTQEITLTMERSLSCSYTMSLESGRDQTISSTVGVSLKLHYD